MTVLTTCFSSGVRRVVASNWRRRSSSGPLIMIEVERICADGQSDREFAEYVEGGHGVACLVAADLGYVDADVLCERVLGQFAFASDGG